MAPTKVNSSYLIAIIGPTASGKTDLALRLAKKFNGVIISADSRQIYQHAQLGTNQPNGKWSRYAKSGVARQMAFGKEKIYFVKNIPHFFIDILSPNKTYSAAKFQKEVNKLFHKLFAISSLPILVGGTGLYVSAIVENYQFPHSKPNPKLRKKLEKLSIKALLAKLKKLDGQTYRAIDKHNRRRIIRALEHILTTGTTFYAEQKRTPRPNTLILGLNPPKNKLRKNINIRTAQMLKKGLLKEVKYIKKHYPTSTLLNTIGYKELLPVLQNRKLIKTAEQQISTHTWQYARHQMTWFKRMPNIKWIKNYTHAKVKAERFLGL
jgi:tRNA dimethylallyltransferase